ARDGWRAMSPREDPMPGAPRGFQEKDVTLANGLTIHYYEWPGPRPTLVLLHPSSGYGRMWQGTADALGSRFHVYALDQRGHGDSGRPDRDYSAGEDAPGLGPFFPGGGAAPPGAAPTATTRRRSTPRTWRCSSGWWAWTAPSSPASR